MDASWTCRQCGWANSGGRFCFECGRDGDPDQLTHQRLTLPRDEDDPSWRRPALVATAIALLVALVVGSAILLSGGDSPKAPPQASAPKPPPAAQGKLGLAQTVDELMKIVVASRAGLAAARKGEWAQAAENRKRLVGRLERLAARTDDIESARTALAGALVASERANDKSLACKDQRAVSACAAPAHRRASALKERFRRAFNRILGSDGREPIAPSSF